MRLSTPKVAPKKSQKNGNQIPRPDNQIPRPKHNPIQISRIHKNKINHYSLNTSSSRIPQFIKHIQNFIRPSPHITQNSSEKSNKIQTMPFNPNIKQFHNHITKSNSTHGQRQKHTANTKNTRPTPRTNQNLTESSSKPNNILQSTTQQEKIGHRTRDSTDFHKSPKFKFQTLENLGFGIEITSAPRV